MTARTMLDAGDSQPLSPPKPVLAGAPGPPGQCGGSGGPHVREVGATMVGGVRREGTAPMPFLSRKTSKRK